MAYKDFDGLSSAGNATNSQIVIPADGESVQLPDASYVRDAAMSREGMDLVLDGPQGEIVIENYFAAEPQPNLVSPDGAALTPQLVNSFITVGADHAQAHSANDQSPVGTVSEVSGEATVTRVDGSVETITIGTKIYEGDIVETDADAAVNIVFIDETSFAVSENARLAIDEYTFDPNTNSGETSFSVLKGIFVFTSGLIGREDPDDVTIDTPVGSIGIRGTVIAGNVDTGEITVVEGAIVLKDFSGNEMTLANQFETAKFQLNGGIENMGEITADDLGSRFSSITKVAPDLFSSVHDAGVEQRGNGESEAAPQEGTERAPSAAPPGTNSGFGTDHQSGLGSGLGTGTSGSAGHGGQTSGTGTTTAAASSNPGDPPPPPPEVQQPDPPPPGGGGGPENDSPVHDRHVPNQFLMSSQGLNWNYHFDKEFFDPDGNNLTFELHANTIAMLNSWDTGAMNILDPDGMVPSWEFNSSTGELRLNFSDDFLFTPGMFQQLNIQIRAVDSHGAATDYMNYNLQAFAPTEPLENVATFNTYSNKVVVDLDQIATGIFIGNSNRVFLANHDDSIVIDGNGTDGSDNYINLGHGHNRIQIEHDAYDNIAVGGDGKDRFVLGTARVEAYGMDGDDTIRFDFTMGGNINSEIGNAGTIIDGGHSNFRAGYILAQDHGLNTQGSMGGRGDTLTLSGPGDLDLTNLHTANSISGIERIDMIASNSADGETRGANTLTLNYDNILQLTDHKRTLIFNLDDTSMGGVDDTLHLELGPNFGNMVKVLDDFMLDDGFEGAAVNRYYDVYTNGEITLLILQDGGGGSGQNCGNVTGLPP